MVQRPRPDLRGGCAAMRIPTVTGVRCSRHRRLNVQTSCSNTPWPFRARTVSAFDPTDFGTSRSARTGAGPSSGAVSPGGAMSSRRRGCRA